MDSGQLRRFLSWFHSLELCLSVMKRLLSLENLSSVNGESHASQCEDDASTAELTATQKLKRSRRVKTRSDLAASNSVGSQFVDQLQVTDSPSLSGSHIISTDCRPCSCACRTVDDTANAANTARLDSLLQLLTEQQQSIASMQGKLASVLSYLQQVSNFLGMDSKPLSNFAGNQSFSLPHAEPRLLTSDHQRHPPLINSEKTDTNEQSIEQADLMPQGSVVSSGASLTDSTQHLLSNPLSHEHNRAGLGKGIKNKPGSSNNLRGMILDALFKESADRESRAKSIVVSGVRATEACDDQSLIRNLLKTEFDFSPELLKCRRLGQPRPDHIQPILVSFTYKEDAAWLVANAQLLRRSRDSWTKHNIFINNNLTFQERRQAYEQRVKRRTTQHRSDFAYTGHTGHTVYRSQPIPDGAQGVGISTAATPPAAADRFQHPIRVIVNSGRTSQDNVPDHRQSDQQPYNLLADLDFPAISRVQGATGHIMHPSTNSRLEQTAVSGAVIIPQPTVSAHSTSNQHAIEDGSSAYPSSSVSAVTADTAKHTSPMARGSNSGLSVSAYSGGATVDGRQSAIS